VICGVEFDKEQLLYSIIDQMKQTIDLVQQQSDHLRFQYTEKLFKIGIPMPFKDN
jgi:BirA family biotin operon repressor/biotin-[acetyl-CoA-carboxylase] ligase